MRQNLDSLVLTFARYSRQWEGLALQSAQYVRGLESHQRYETQAGRVALTAQCSQLDCRNKSGIRGDG